MIPAISLLSNKNIKVNNDNDRNAEEEIWKFLTRAEKMNRTTFPENTLGRLIIRGKNDGYGFIEKIDPKLLEMQPAVESEIIKIIRDLNKISSKVYCMKRKNDEYDFLQNNIGLLQLIFALVIVGFIVLACSNSYRENTALFYAGILILAVSALLVVFVASLLSLKEKRHISLMKELSTQIQNYIDSKNQTLIDQMGAKMTLEKELRWIELEYQI